MVCWRVHELAPLDPSHCISHTSYDLPVRVMRLLCPITGHKEIFVQVREIIRVSRVISFGGKIAYYGLGKLEEMGSVLVPDHLRLVGGDILNSAHLQRVEWQDILCEHYTFYVNHFSFSLPSYTTSRPHTLWHTPPPKLNTLPQILPLFFQLTFDSFC